MDLKGTEFIRRNAEITPPDYSMRLLTIGVFIAFPLPMTRFANMTVVSLSQHRRTTLAIASNKLSAILITLMLKAAPINNTQTACGL
jgi:hypothetical protein